MIWSAHTQIMKGATCDSSTSEFGRLFQVVSCFEVSKGQTLDTSPPCWFPVSRLVSKSGNGDPEPRASWRRKWFQVRPTGCKGYPPGVPLPCLITRGQLWPFLKLFQSPSHESNWMICHLGVLGNNSQVGVHSRHHMTWFLLRESEWLLESNLSRSEGGILWYAYIMHKKHQEKNQGWIDTSRTSTQSLFNKHQQTML